MKKNINLFIKVAQPLYWYNGVINQCIQDK